MDDYKIKVNAVQTTGEEGTAIDENVVDSQAKYDKAGNQVPQTYWEDNTPAVGNTVKGMTLDIQNAKERTTTNGTKYFVVNINNIFGVNFNKVTVFSSNPIVFKKGNGNKLTLAGMAGLTVKMLRGAITGGLFTGGKGSLTIGYAADNADGIYASDTLTVESRGFADDIAFAADDNNLLSVTTDKTPGGTVIVEGDYKFKLDGNNFKLASTAKDATTSGAAVFTYTDDGLVLDISDIIVYRGTINVSATCGATALVLPEATAATEIKISGEYFIYTVGGAAFFKLDSAGKPDGFVFGDEGDSILLTKSSTVKNFYDENTATTVNLGFTGNIERTVTKADYGFTVAVDFQDAGDAFFINGENTAYKLRGITYNGDEITVPTITGDIAYSMEMTEADTFEITGIDAGSVVTGTNMTVAFDEDGGAVSFDVDGNVKGLDNFKGTIDLAAGQASDGFTINGNPIITDEAVTITSDGKEITAANITLTNASKSSVAPLSPIKDIDGSTRTKAVSITGNELDNVISGGSKNDTLIGGTGNDSLWGDAGADTFIYEEGGGKDVIFGFEEDDTLTLDGLDFTASYKKGVVSLKFEDGGSISLKDSATKSYFHIDNGVYKISGSKFVKK